MTWTWIVHMDVEQCMLLSLLEIHCYEDECILACNPVGEWKL